MKYALTYGLLSGLVIIVTLITGIVFSGHESFFSSEWFGYLVMLVALTFIFVGVKRYRDVKRSGVIKFEPAFSARYLRIVELSVRRKSPSSSTGTA